MRKALMAEQYKNDMQSRIKELEDTCEDLLQQIKAATDRKEEVIRRDEELRMQDQTDHEKTIAFMNDLNADYKQELEGLLAITGNKEKI